MTEITDFQSAIAAIPYAPTQTSATGLVAAIMRASGHILYLTGALAEPGYTLTVEEAARELAAAKDHLTRTIAVAGAAPISATARQRVTAFVTAVLLAHDEYGEWPEDERGNNLRALADRAAALGAFFDFELAGLPNSDPGRTL